MIEFNGNEGDISIQRDGERHIWEVVPNSGSFVIQDGCLIVFGNEIEQPIAAFAVGTWREVKHNDAFLKYEGE